MSKIHHCVYKKGHEMNLAEKMNNIAKHSINNNELKKMYARAIEHIEKSSLEGHTSVSHKDTLHPMDDVYNEQLAKMLVKDGFKVVRTRGDITSQWILNIDWTHPIDDEPDYSNGNFIDDKEKMDDFKILSKRDFLDMYSYLTEEEYDNTYAIYWRNKR